MEAKKHGILYWIGMVLSLPFWFVLLTVATAFAAFIIGMVSSIVEALFTLEFMIWGWFRGLF